MKKATLKSLATWTAAAGGLIGYQLVSQQWPAIANTNAERFVTAVVVGILILSLKFMDHAPPQALLPSTRNSGARNILNVANFAAGVIGAVSLLYLGGFFGPNHIGSAVFWSAVLGITGGIAFQAVFALATSVPGQAA